LTIQKRDKKRKYTRRAVEEAAPSEKAQIPQADKMVKNDDICKWCGRRMLDVRCQCGYVRPRNKME
jgi:hypothetical protein